MAVEDVKKFVQENRITAEFIEHHDSDGLTSEGAAAAVNVPLNHIIKVLCFVDGKGNRCFVIIQGSKKVDDKKIPGLKKPRMANAAELKEWFGFEPGCIAPINLPENIPKFIDAGIRDLQFVVGSAGSRFVGLKISPEYIIGQENASLVELGLP